MSQRYHKPPMLHSAFPELAEHLPWLSLADLPTPVQALEPMGPKAWIKRDDISHPVYGGNKIRKLEFILAEVQQRGANRVITFGATGTNHGVATAMLCQQLGLRCTVLLFDQPDSKTVQQNLQRMQQFGADLVFCGSLASTVMRFYCHPKRLSADTYFLFAGGSNVAGTMGFINAAYELKQQIEDKQCPQPAKIFVPVGSSATLAGLTIGMALAQLEVEIVGIRVAPSHLGIIPTCTVSTVQKLIKQTRRRLTESGIDVPPVPSPILIDDYYGEGYGDRSEAGDKATEAFERCGVNLDQTYTAKAAAALLDSLEDSPDKVQLYWHTFNSRP